MSTTERLTTPAAVPAGSRFLHRVSFNRSADAMQSSICDVLLDGTPMGTIHLDPNGTHDRWQAPDGEIHCTTTNRSHP